MMQSKFGGKVTSALRNQFVVPRISPRNLGAITGGSRTPDPAVHAVNPQEKDDASEAAKAAPPPPTNSCYNNQSEFKPTTLKDEDPYVFPKNPSYPPSESSPKVQRRWVNHPPEPLARQKRRRSVAVDVNCVGWDGSPLAPEDKKLDRRRQNEEQEKDNKEYFQHHRASPLSELKVADTRKPITRATDGTAGSGYFGTPELVLWRPEQLDTAEESLRRAREIWMSNAMRGDPDSPHGRILRTLRGEYW